MFTELRKITKRMNRIEKKLDGLHEKSGIARDRLLKTASRIDERMQSIAFHIAKTINRHGITKTTVLERAAFSPIPVRVVKHVSA